MADESVPADGAASVMRSAVERKSGCKRASGLQAVELRGRATKGIVVAETADTRKVRRVKLGIQILPFCAVSTQK